jgi:hypothetical protein
MWTPINLKDALTCPRTFIQVEPESFRLIRLVARVEQPIAARSLSVAQCGGRLW